MVALTIFCQILLLAYHQLTTHVDFYPFNGARNYSRGEKFAEAGTNLVLMSLAPVGFALYVHALAVPSRFCRHAKLGRYRTSNTRSCTVGHLSPRW